MRGLRSVFTLALLLTVPLAGQTNEWKRYKNPEGNFAILFAGQPKESVNAADESAQSRTLKAQEGNATYIVVYSRTSAEQTVDEETFQNFKTAFLKALPKCEAEPEQPAMPALAGYIGHAYRLNCDMPGKVTIVGNLYWGKHYSYAVMTIYPTETDEPKSKVRTFLDSFGLLDAAK